MAQSALSPGRTATQRLDYARKTLLMFTRRTETYLRDKWSRECGDAGRPIVHMISGPDPRYGSVRINMCATDHLLTEAGQSVARWIIQEHGGCLRCVSDTFIEATRMTPAAAVLLVCNTVNRSEFWYKPEVERW